MQGWTGVYFVAPDELGPCFAAEAPDRIASPKIDLTTIHARLAPSIHLAALPKHQLPLFLHSRAGLSPRTAVVMMVASHILDIPRPRVCHARAAQHNTSHKHGTD